jgi:hypothetical protein
VRRAHYAAQAWGVSESYHRRHPLRHRPTQEWVGPDVPRWVLEDRRLLG